MNIARTLLVAAIILGAAQASPAQKDYNYYCQILDRLDEPIWNFSFSYTERADLETEDPDDFGMANLSMQSGFIYLRTDYGDFDIGARIDMTAITGDGDINLPDQVGETVVDVRWVVRNEGGWAIRFEASPGFYSDFEDLSLEDVNVPFGLSGIFALHPRLSGLAGLMIYPEFDRLFDPRVGVRWAISNDVLLDLFYPDSRLLYAISDGWEVFAGLRIRKYPEYQLKEDDPRAGIQYDENRLYVGVHRFLSDQLRLSFQLGQAFEREIDFETGFDSTKVEDTLFFGVSIGGLL